MTKKQSSFVSVLTFLFIMLFATSSFATYTLTVAPGYGPYQAGSGGEFTATPGSGLELQLGLYDAKVIAPGYQGSFQTFCLEGNEYLYADTTYYVMLSYFAIGGGLGGVNDDDIDPLSAGAAWLYWQFATGKLEGYHYAAGDATELAARKASAVALQDAIWWLEEEYGDPGDGNLFRQAVLAKFGSLENARADNFDGKGNVFPVAVANLWEFADGSMESTDGRRQDVLVLLPGTPVPIPGAVWLLGAGLIGLVGIRRRLRG